MDGLFVCDLAQIALYSSVGSGDGWIQKILFPRNACIYVCICVCVYLRGFLCSVLLRDREFANGSRWEGLRQVDETC